MRFSAGEVLGSVLRVPESDTRMVKGLFKGTKSSEMRMAGAGIELAGAILIFTFIGYGIDIYFDSSPWGMITLALLAVVGGTYNLIKEGLQQFKNEDGSSDKSDQSPSKD